MHTGNIENYNFLHGLHRNMVNGKWFPLHPHTLGRPLTHDEMDYNLLYSQQTLAGWRIFGQNENLTLSDDELTKSLIFWKISATDTDYNRYVAAGYSEGQYIWITPLFSCDDFTVSSGSVTDTSGDTCEGFIITMSSSTETTDSCDIFGISASGSTNSTGFLPTATPEPTATEVPPTATPAPTATEVPPTATPEPTATATPEPTATEVPPTATPEPTATATPAPTATAAPAPQHFNWVVSTDAAAINRINPVLEDQSTEPTCWNDSNQQYWYFPLEAGQTYYWRVEPTLPTSRIQLQMQGASPAYSYQLAQDNFFQHSGGTPCNNNAGPGNGNSVTQKWLEDVGGIYGPAGNEVAGSHPYFVTDYNDTISNYYKFTVPANAEDTSEFAYIGLSGSYSWNGSGYDTQFPFDNDEFSPVGFLVNFRILSPPTP